MKKHSIFLVLLIFFSLISLPSEDSKEAEARLPGSEGKERIEILLELAKAYQYKEPKKTLEYCKEAVKLLQTFPDRELEIEILNQMSTTNLLIGNYLAAGENALKHRDIAQKINDKIGEADAICNLGRAYSSQGRYEEAKDCYYKAQEIYSQKGDKKGPAKAFQLMGNIYFRIGDFSIAMEYAFKAVDIYETLGDQRGIADLKNMCGIISSASGDYQQGLAYLLEANRRYETLGDKSGVARTLNNIGFTYSSMGKPSESLKYFKKSLEISREMGSKELLSTVLTSIGETYAQMQNHQQALNYFARSLEIVQANNDSDGIAYNLLQIGKAKGKLGQYREARQSLIHALEIARKINIKNEIRNAAKELSEIFEILGDHQKALLYYREYMEIDEALFKERNRKKMVEIQTRYETHGKEKELSLLKKDRQLQQLELDQQANTRKSVLTIVLLVLFLALVTYTAYRLKTRATKALSKEIREHKQTTQKLRESEEKFRTLAEKSVVGICIIRDNIIQYANPAFSSIFRYPPEEIIGMNPLKLVIEEDRAKVYSPDADFTDYEFRGLSKEGNLLHLESHSVRTRYQGQPAILQTVIDITQRKKVEAELLKMRKLESVGILAGSIAHDFNHLLSRVSSDTEKLKEMLRKHADLGKMVENIKKISQKATELAQKLIIFSEGGGTTFREVTLNSILQGVFDTYPQMQELAHNISIPSGLNPIYGDEEDLCQVFSNLLWNAQEAKNHNNHVKVTIIAENKTLTPGNDVSLKPGKYTKIFIADNGKGIPSHQLDKVFDPYFSTKETFHQKGMGLGLAICYSIVKKHNGHISIRSEKEQGTTVEILLPAYNE